MILVFLAETHAGPNLNFSKIGSFHCHDICWKQSKHNKRYFGGLTVMIKNKLKPYIKIRNNTNPDYQWVKLENNHFGFSEDIYICCVYYLPSCSAYTQSFKHDRKWGCYT